MGRLDGRVGIVTGAGMGIGRGIARRLASEGATIIVADRVIESATHTVAELKRDFGVEALALEVDVSDRAQIDRLVSTVLNSYGRVDILINNAWARIPGVPAFSPIEEKTDVDFEHAFRIGYMAALWAMQAVFPIMKDRRWGRIINIASLNGVNAHPYTVDYNSAKEALRALTRTAAREWAMYQICCNVICPAAETDAYRAFAREHPDNAAQLLRLNPMGRMGDPEMDIGSVALFLSSDDCRYVTGNTLFVDGGGHINGVPWLAGGV